MTNLFFPFDEQNYSRLVLFSFFLKYPLITSKYLNNIVGAKLLTDIMTKSLD